MLSEHYLPAPPEVQLIFILTLQVGPWLSQVSGESGLCANLPPGSAGDACRPAGGEHLVVHTRTLVPAPARLPSSACLQRPADSNARLVST